MDALDAARALLSSGHSQDHSSFYPGEDRGNEVIVGLPHWPQGKAPRLGCGPGLSAKKRASCPQMRYCTRDGGVRASREGARSRDALTA